MKQNMKAALAAAVLILLLAGCGQFAIESQVAVEATPTAVPASGAEDADAFGVQDAANAPTDPTTAPGTQAPRLPRFGLVEILIVTGTSIVASLLLGAYLLLTDRPKVFDPRPMQADQPEPTTLRNLLQFRPNLRAVVLSLCGWTFTLGVLAVAFVGGLVLVTRDAGGSGQEIRLTVPTAILLENKGNYVGISLADLVCSLDGSPDQERLLCDMPIEGEALKLDVVLTAGTFWNCTATYGGQDVPCRGSFSNENLKTFIVLNSTLGLSEAQLRQLAATQPGSGMTEAQWLGLAQVTAGALALAALVLLWRRSRAQITAPSRAKTALAATYSLSVTAMLFGTLYYVSLLSLLLLGVID